ncbi:TRAP transporter substrate-binding protein [Mangrovicoccus sp. HB161399]|uniref:TRAP transporter substrate-binding protein n=1 Tax=Mangrovicoccus sp. HB161399 TaxID=2720392 RepID=UPI0015550FF3|nr:TRAP transporter substrate-binding protein [Mangrovicoccus sp. HB161399]
MKYTLAVAALLSTTAAAWAADTVTLRIQTHQAPEAVSGKLVADFVEQVRAMSEGSIDIEMFYSSSVVASAETFDAAANGIIDCDMTNGSYQAGKNPAFQFVADVMGGYDTPIQYLAWIEEGGGREAIQKLYEANGMHFIGAYLGGQESLASSAPLAGIADLQGWKFRSPPGMESEIFASLGASPVVMDYTEIFTSLETGIIDGADASTLAANLSNGIYDIAKHTTYPGFHSMSSDHLACSTAAWEKLSSGQQAILENAMEALAMRLLMRTEVLNSEALAELPAKGVTFYDWSAEDRAKFREAAVARWDEWAKKTPETAEMVASHKAFLHRIGLDDD